MEEVSDRLIAHLNSLDIEFKIIDHGPTRTSEESAEARGEPLGVGAKALLLKSPEEFFLAVLPADKKLDSGALKRVLGIREFRFATPEELFSLTGLVPGSVPPFGAPIFPFRLYADTGIGEEYDRVAFNAGSLTRSVVMKVRDWLAIAAPTRFLLSKAT